MTLSFWFISQHAKYLGERTLRSKIIARTHTHSADRLLYTATNAAGNKFYYFRLDRERRGSTAGLVGHGKVEAATTAVDCDSNSLLQSVSVLVFVSELTRSNAHAHTHAHTFWK